ncbi:hypothetical protein OsccyDRAFT_3247 [Leptolyngbyaceae cyanobacterium JSC-12]|nr:hypothetical protein OsccyDRAFT_3247 [Leptolyngbyaceae cyanobacterium JSC-12]
MEDLAYIYLALNEESERAESLLETAHLQTPLSNWAPPIKCDCPLHVPASIQTDWLVGAPKVQDMDVDFNPHSCPSGFYL